METILAILFGLSVLASIFVAVSILAARDAKEQDEMRESMLKEMLENIRRNEQECSKRMFNEPKN